MRQAAAGCVSPVQQPSSTRANLQQAEQDGLRQVARLGLVTQADWRPIYRTLVEDLHC